MRAVILVALSCILASVSSQSHDLVVGQATYGDIVVFKGNNYKYGLPFLYRTSNVEYPLPDQQNFAYIRAIYVQDHATDGTGGYASISSGGIGQQFVNILLQSQQGYGFNFTVTIYGRY